MATYYCARIATDAPTYGTDIQAELCENILRDCADLVPNASLRIEFRWFEYKCVTPAL